MIAKPGSVPEGHTVPEGHSVPEGQFPGKAKLLVVDDDPMTCRLLKIQLEMEGHPCVTLSDPRRVFEVIEEEAPELILVDFHLGTQEGLDLLQAIRSRQEYTHLPIVIMSGIDYQGESELAGADGFVLKPFGLQDLVATLQEVLSRSAGSTENRG